MVTFKERQILIKANFNVKFFESVLYLLCVFRLTDYQYSHVSEALGTRVKYKWNH